MYVYTFKRKVKKTLKTYSCSQWFTWESKEVLRKIFHLECLHYLRRAEQLGFTYYSKKRLTKVPFMGYYLPIEMFEERVQANG
jgi:hypothetical protein